MQVFFEQISIKELKGIFREIIRDELQASGLLDNTKANYLTRKQAAKKLSISLPTLTSWTNQNRIRSIKIGGRVLYEESDLNNLITK